MLNSKLFTNITISECNVHFSDGVQLRVRTEIFVRSVFLGLPCEQRRDNFLTTVLYQTDWTGTSHFIQEIVSHS